MGSAVYYSSVRGMREFPNSMQELVEAHFPESAKILRRYSIKQNHEERDSRTEILGENNRIKIGKAA